MSEETKTDLITAAKGLPPPEIFSLRPRTFDEAFRFANLIAESTLIPKEFQKSPANVLIAVQFGMELGVSPMQALQSMYVVNGRPSIFGDLPLAIVMQSGLLEEFEETGDEKEAACTVKRKGMKPITRTFSMAEAERAGLVARNPTYKNFPKRMLGMRARAFALRDRFPDLLKGVAIKEELDDVEMRDVTPVRMPEAIKEPNEAKPEPEKVRDIRRTAKPKLDVTQGEQKVESDSQSGDVVPSGPVETRKQAVQPEAPPAEKTQEDLIQECILWAENAPEDEIEAEDNFAMRTLKQIKGTQNQVQVLKPLNARRQAILKARKAE